MLRRRLIIAAKKIVRSCSELKVVIYNKIRTIATSVPAILAKLQIEEVTHSKMDSVPYDASLSNINTHIAASPSLKPDEYEALLTNVNVAAAAQPNIAPNLFDSSIAKSTNKLVILKKTDAIAASEANGVSTKIVTNNILVDAEEYTSSLGISIKEIEIDSLTKALSADSERLDMRRVQDINSKTEALSGDANCISLKVSTCDKPEMAPVACEKIYSHVDVYAGVSHYIAPNEVESVDAKFGVNVKDSVYIDADLAISNLSLLNTNAGHVSAYTNPEGIASVSTDFSTKGSILVTFAPTAKVVEWLDPILTDGTLLIRQAYGINKNNNTLEVI